MRKYIALAFVSLMFYTVFDTIASRQLENQLGTIETLKRSSFARTMFMDIGVLSTIFSYWILYKTKVHYRFIFAPLTLFIGSFSVLPFLWLYLSTPSQKDH